MRAAASRALEAQYRDMTDQLDKQNDIIISRLEELFERQHEILMNSLVSLQWSVPTDSPAAGPRSAVGPDSKGLGVGVADVETQTIELPQNVLSLSAVNGTKAMRGSIAVADEQKSQRITDAKAIEVPQGAAAAVAFVAAEDNREQFLGVEVQWWKRVVLSQRFDMAFGILILLNSLVMVVELEHFGLQAGAHLGKNSMGEADWPHAKSAFLLFDHLFCWIFLIEMLMRIATWGGMFFGIAANWIDIVSVGMSIFDLYLLPAMQLSLPNLTFIRVLRLVKLVKVLRIIRVMRLFHQLRVLAVAVASSVGALMWSVIFLTLVQAIAAILMTQLLMPFIQDLNRPQEVRSQVYHYFGRWSYSMLTMYQITMAPPVWGPIGRLLIYEVSSLFVLFFIPYGWLVTFAVIRVISAMFLKQTMQAASGDGEVAILERMETKEKETKKLLEIFSVGDTDGSGCVDFEEFQAMLEQPIVKTWLAMMEMDVTDMNMVFKLLDDGDGQISFQEFINGILRCRGGARGIDVASLLGDCQKIIGDLGLVRSMLEDRGLKMWADEYVSEGSGTENKGQKDSKGGKPKNGSRLGSAIEDNNLEMEKAIMGETDVSAEMAAWKQIVLSKRFDIGAGLLICLNAVVMAIELEYLGIAAGIETGVEAEPGATASPLPGAFAVLDHMFCNLFLLELGLRIAAYGADFFKHPVNWLDITTVALSIVELYLLELFKAQNANIALIRLVRMLRLGKVIRILRVVTLFHQLRVLVASIANTIAALAWAIVLVGVLQAIAAILMTTFISESILARDSTDPDAAQAFDYFGRWTRTMITMHEITMAPGPWGSIGRLLIFKMSPWYLCFFIAWGWGVTFAVINVISAIFSKQTLATAAGDGETATMERMRKKKKDIERLKEIFSAGDKDGSGSVDWSEFQNMLTNPRVRAWLGILDLDISDMATVFTLLDDGDGHIEFSEFIEGVMKCRGPARGFEVVNLLNEYRQIMFELNEIKYALQRTSVPETT